MKRYLWVVEVFDHHSRDWMSTMYVALTRREGRVMLRRVRDRNLYSKYKLSMYRVEG